MKFEVKTATPYKPSAIALRCPHCGKEAAFAPISEADDIDIGDATAQYNLARMYNKGRGVTQDDKEAVKWYQKAAAQGVAHAQHNLGFMHANGRGVIQDFVLGHMWCNIATSNGYKKAKKNRDAAESKMTSEQIVKAQELARECIKKNYKDCG